MRLVKRGVLREGTDMGASCFDRGAGAGEGFCSFSVGTGLMRGFARRIGRRFGGGCRLVAAGMMAMPSGLAARLAVGALIAQALVIGVFLKTNVMLYGDGAWFVFALATGQPWLLKWRSIAARSTVYALTVWPVLQISQWAQLAPMQIAMLNCGVFYGLQLVLTGWGFWLAWKLGPRFVVFPVAQLVWFTLLGWGFPSELLLGPGILWVALFSAARARGVTGLAVLGFVALVFTHELALPAALVAGGFALALEWRRARAGARFWLTGAVMLGAVVALFWVRGHGGGVGSDSNGIYVFDPRRVLANPVLVPLVGGAVFLRWRGGPKGKAAGWRLGMLCGVVLAGVLAVGLLTSLNFDAARYGARTLIGLGMLGLAVVFVFAFDGGRVRPAAEGARGAPGLAIWLAVSLAVQLGALGVFVHDWMLASAAEQGVARAAVAGVAPRLLAIGTARQGWSEAQRAASIRLQLEWPTPFRQFVLSDGAMPGVILYDESRAYIDESCPARGVILNPGSRFRADGAAPWSRIACSHKRPPNDSISARVRDWLRAEWR